MRRLRSVVRDPFLPDFASLVSDGTIDPFNNQTIVWYRSALLDVQKDLCSLLPEDIVSTLNLRSVYREATGISIPLDTAKSSVVHCFLSAVSTPTLTQCLFRVRGEVVVQAFIGPSNVPEENPPGLKLNGFSGPFDAVELVVQELNNFWSYYEPTLS